MSRKLEVFGSRLSVRRNIECWFETVQTLTYPTNSGILSRVDIEGMRSAYCPI